MSEQEYTLNDPPATKECKYCHKIFYVGHSKRFPFVLLTFKGENHFNLSPSCYDEFKKDQASQKQEQEKEKLIKSVEIKPGSGYGIVMMTELMKVVKSLDDATTVNNVAVLKRLNEIDAKLDGIGKMIEGLMP